MDGTILTDSRKKRTRMVKSLFLLYLNFLGVAAEFSIPAPVLLGTNLKDGSSANANSDAEPTKNMQRLQLNVNVLRRRIAIELPYFDNLLSLASKEKQQIPSENSHKDKKLDARPISRTSRKLQSTMDTKSLSSSVSCVDVTSFVTFVNKNVRDCSWVKSQGRCDTYGTFCPVTCSSCDPSGSVSSLEQVLNQNLQVQGTNKASNSDASVATTSSGTDGGKPNSSTSTSNNDDSNINEDASNTSQKFSNKNESPSTNSSLNFTDSSTIEVSNNTTDNDVTSKSSTDNGRNSTITPLSSDIILVKFSFTTLTESQRKSLMDGTLSISEIMEYLVTADELEPGGSVSGSKILEAILMTVSEILNSETFYIIPDDDSISSTATESNSQNNTLILFYNQSLTNNEIANDGSNGWVDLSLPYQVIEMSSERRTLRDVSIHQVNDYCNEVIHEHIADGTLLKMLTLSTNSRIKAVSISEDKVLATPKPRSSISRFFQETNGLTLFAIGVCSVVLMCLLFLWASFITSKAKQRKQWRNYEDDVRNVILSMESENKKPNDGSELMINTTFDSSAPLADDSNHSSSSREPSLNSGRSLKPTVYTSRTKDMSDISTSSSRSGRLNNLASDGTAKMSHRWIPSIRKLMKTKSADSSVRAQNFVTHSPEATHQQMHFHVASVSGPPSILKHPEERTTDEESMAGTIFGKIQRCSNKNTDDGTASAFMGSNNSYWGDTESPEDFDVAALDEVVFYDSEASSSPEKISPSGSVHYVNTPETDHGFTLSGFIDQVQDAVFDALYSSDSTSNDITSISEDANESSLKSLSSIISDRQTLPSPDNTKDNIKPNELTSSDNTTDIIKTHDVVPADIISHPILKTSVARATTNQVENPNSCCDGTLQVCYHEISEAFSSFWKDPRDVMIARRKLLTYPTQK